MPKNSPIFTIHGAVSSEGIQKNPEAVKAILDTNAVGNPLYDFFSQHEAIANPKTESVTALRWDINRMDGVYTTDGKDVTGDIKLAIDSRDTLLRDNTTAKYLMPEKKPDASGAYDEFTKQRIQKMQGLCQDVGNSSAIVFARNFCLKVDTQDGVIDVYGDMKGKETQNLVKLDESTYRYDYEAVQYYCIGSTEKTNGYVFARRTDGEIITIDLGSTPQFKDKKMNLDGSITINDNGQEVTLLPLLKTNTSAVLSFDDKNNASVVLEYDFTGYTDKLNYDKYSVVAGMKVDGLECSIQKNENLNEFSRRNSVVGRLRENDESVDFFVVPSIRSFPTINNQKVEEGLQLLEKLSRYLELSHSMTELNNLIVLKNKTPAKEMGAYQNFFNAWKEKYANNKEILKFVQEWQIKIMTSGFSEQDRVIQLGVMMGEFRNRIEAQNKGKLNRSKVELPPLPSSPSHHGVAAASSSVTVLVTSSSSEASSPRSSEDSLSVTSSSASSTSSSNTSNKSNDDNDVLDNKTMFFGKGGKDRPKESEKKFLFFGTGHVNTGKEKTKKNNSNNNKNGDNRPG